jgi:hypothetical protein
MHTHTRAHMHTRACTRARAHAHAHMYIYTRAHAHTRMHTRTCTHTNTHMHTRAYAHAHTHVHTQTCTHARTHTFIYRTAVFMALEAPEPHVTPARPSTTTVQHCALSGGVALRTHGTNTRPYNFQEVIIFQKRKLEVLLSGGNACSFTQTCPLRLGATVAYVQPCKRTRS